MRGGKLRKESEMVEIVYRNEDMSTVGKLQLLQQTDGDVIVSIIPEEEPCGCGVAGRSQSVEFCTSGGRSPNTLHALRALMVAMAQDNKENPLD